MTPKFTERLFGVKYVAALERDRTEVIRSKTLLDRAGVSTGNEHQEYSLSERVQWLITVKEFWQKKADSFPVPAPPYNPPNLPQCEGATADPEQTEQVARTARNE